MKLKNNIFVVILSLFLGFTVAFLTAEKTEGAQQIQQGIAGQIIRFHVIANSDTEQDQALKLKVKSEINKNIYFIYLNSFIKGTKIGYMSCNKVARPSSYQFFKRERAKNLPFRPYYLPIASISSPCS